MPWSLPAWGDAAVTVAAVLLALGTIYRYVVPALRGLWRLGHGTYRLVEDFRDTGGFAGLSAQTDALASEVGAVKALALKADHELHPNGGSSMRDSVARIEATTEQLRGYATESREGISDLREQTNQLSRRLTDVDEKATALGERQEVLRTADQQLARDLQHYIETKHADLLLANEGLRAALNEALAIDDDDL